MRPTFLAALVVAAPLAARQPVELNVPAPELAGVTAWINTKPVVLADLKGKVVVLHFYAFGCVNCVRNLPHYAGWHRDFAAKGVMVVGVHTPETAAEQDVASVRRKAMDADMKYPIAVDGAAATWRAWDNRWWPCAYLIDKRGVVRWRWDGELNWQGATGEKQMRERIEQLLAEKP